MGPSVSNSRVARQSPLVAALKACRGAFAVVGLFTGVINILMLTGSLFMLQVYDRVLPSRSVPTLVALLILVAALYAFQGVLDTLRVRMLVRIGRALDDQIGIQVYQAIARLPLKTQNRGDGLQPMRDLDQVRSFLSSTGPTALFDLPWMPLYLAVCFAFHVWIGVTALAGAIILVGLTLLTEFLTRAPAKASSGAASGRVSLAEASRRNAEVLQAMGMVGRVSVLWRAANTKYMDAQQKTSDVAGGLGSASRVLRMLLQSCVLAVGAYLVINQEATAGIIIASSILVSRALAPVELSIANWKTFQAARQSWRKLSDLVSLWPEQSGQLQLPTPCGTLSIESLTLTPPGLPKAVVQDISFRLSAGQGLGVIGPSAAGKSSLARGIVGVWQPARGKVRLDGAALDQWTPEALGPSIGYLPQDVELFDGTVAQNIARFEADAKSEEIVAAARNAGVHDLVVRLPDGYETKVGEGGAALSAGQRQRIALARALYGDPFLLVLDEPNSNLDTEGDEALARAIGAARNRGAIVIVIAHRPSALQNVDMVLAMANGRQQAFGPKDEVLRKILDRSRTVPRPMKVVGEGEGIPA